MTSSTSVACPLRAASKSRSSAIGTKPGAQTAAGAPVLEHLEDEKGQSLLFFCFCCAVFGVFLPFLLHCFNVFCGFLVFWVVCGCLSRGCLDSYSGFSPCVLAPKAPNSPPCTRKPRLDPPQSMAPHGSQAWP